MSTPRGKPCTCDNCLGSSCACRVEAGERLGDLWYCRKQYENPISFQQAVAEYRQARIEQLPWCPVCSARGYHAWNCSLNQK
jgi:hypothetical protein